jgi:hypothetical protein
MSFTSPFLTWLGANGARRCLIAEVAVRVGGVEITRYLSTTGYTSEPADTPASQLYTGRITGSVSFTRRLDLQGSGGSIAFGDIELDNEDGALDDWPNDIWAGRAITLYLGQVNWPKSSFELAFAGTVDDITPKSRSSMSLKLRDILGPLNSTLSTATIGGTRDNKNALRPICLGECFNVSPVLLDPTVGGGEYAVHTNSAIEGVIEERDNGIAVASTVTAAAGKFSLTNARYGTITCDPQGAKVAGVWRNDVGGLVEWVALASVGDGNGIVAGQIDATALTAFRAACAQPVGLYVTDRGNRLQVMQQLAASVGATVTTTYNGKLILVRVAFGSPVGTISTRQMVDGTFAPLSRPAIQGAVRLAGERNWTPQTSGLAGSLTDAQPQMFGDEYIYFTSSDATVLANYGQSATPAAVETLLIVEADLTAESLRRLALWKVPHTVYGFDGFPECFAYEIGETRTLTFPRFGMSAGVPALIVGIQHDWVKCRARIEVLV